MQVGKPRVLIAWLTLPILFALALYLGLFQLCHLGAFDEIVKERALYLEVRKMQPNEWFGVKCWQFPEDLLLYQEILVETKPDFVIETGTYYGGLSLFLASVLESVNPDGKVITVDVDGSHWRETVKTFNLPVKDRLLSRIEFLEGSSIAPEIVQKIAAQVKGKKVMAILDSDHSKAFVLKEAELYGNLVSVNNYLIVNDTILEKYFPPEGNGGAAPAVREFLATGSFVIDTSKHRYIYCNAYNGYLKKVH